MWISGIGGITNLSAPDGPSADPTPEPPAEINQPTAPSAPPSQSFKCEKCGAAFDDEGSAAAHIQTCKGIEAIPDDEVTN